MVTQLAHGAYGTIQRLFQFGEGNRVWGRTGFRAGRQRLQSARHHSDAADDLAPELYVRGLCVCLNQYFALGVVATDPGERNIHGDGKARARGIDGRWGERRDSRVDRGD